MGDRFVGASTDAAVGEFFENELRSVGVAEELQGEDSLGAKKGSKVAASSAVDGEGTLLKEVTAAHRRSAIRWTPVERLRTVCGEAVSPRTRRKSARLANGRGSPV
eukprot:4393711-Pleurochrysis_carterae.AAC.3